MKDPKANATVKRTHLVAGPSNFDEVLFKTQTSEDLPYTGPDSYARTKFRKLVGGLIYCYVNLRAILLKEQGKQESAESGTTVERTSGVYKKDTGKWGTYIMAIRKVLRSLADIS